MQQPAIAALIWISRIEETGSMPGAALWRGHPTRTLCNPGR
jgi:hypothetical protein